MQCSQQVSTTIVYRQQTFTKFNITWKFQLQPYINGRPLYNSMLHVNFNYNRIGMVGLYILQCYMYTSIATLYRWQAFTRFNVTCKLQLQSYWNGRPLYNAMLAVNFYYNRIGLAGLHIYILSLINIHEMVTWLIKIA